MTLVTILPRDVKERSNTSGYVNLHYSKEFIHYKQIYIQKKYISIHLFIYLLIHQAFIKHLLCTRHGKYKNSH